MEKLFFILICASGCLFLTGCQPDPDDDAGMIDDMTGVCFEEISGECADLIMHPTMVDLSNVSCSGFCVMRKFLQSCPSDLNINGEDLSVSGYLSIFYNNPDFGFDDVIASNVLVHESMHSLAYTEATSNDNLFVMLDCENDWQVAMTNTFPSNELLTVIDAENRTSRFDGYIDASQFHVTQTRGVYGLLNEFMSYYQSGLVTYEMSKAMGLLDNPDDAVLYSINAAIPYYEFRYWILTYLIYAAENHPTIYNEVMANQAFKDSFNEIDNAFLDIADKVSTASDPLTATSEINTVNIIAEMGTAPYLEMISLLEE